MDFVDRIKSYAQRGWYIVPVHGIKEGMCTCADVACETPGKHLKSRRGLKDATRDLEKIEKWFSEEHTNVGIATGKKSGLTVIDVNIGSGRDEKARSRSMSEWRSLTGENGPKTLCALSGSSGLHYFFKYKKDIKTSANSLGEGINVRSDGAYIIVSPSESCAGKYRWIKEDEEIVEFPIFLTNESKKLVKNNNKAKDALKEEIDFEDLSGMIQYLDTSDPVMVDKIADILGNLYPGDLEVMQWYVKWASTSSYIEEQLVNMFMDPIKLTSPAKYLIDFIERSATERGWTKRHILSVDDFVYYGPGNVFIYRPTLTQWVKEAVDAGIEPILTEKGDIKASVFIKKTKFATSMTIDPSIETDYLNDHDCVEGCVIKKKGAALFNGYRKPEIQPGDASLAGPFLSHVKRIFNKEGDADQFLSYIAHRVQKPGEKPRFALLIAGPQGAGKDTAVDFCVPAIGQWNVANVDQKKISGAFDDYATKILIRISEAASKDNISKWEFNEQIKVLISGNPDTAIINPKYGKNYSVRMCCGVIVTTNHMVGGVYIPQGDRRYDVIESATKEEMGIDDDEKCREYFEDLHDWFISGGDAHVAAYLRERDITAFSASRSQRKTDAYRCVIEVENSADDWIKDILDAMCYPDLVSTTNIILAADRNGERPYSVGKRIKYAMHRVGYVLHRNDRSKDGRWKIGGRSQVVYRKKGVDQNIDTGDLIDFQAKSMPYLRSAQ